MTVWSRQPGFQRCALCQALKVIAIGNVCDACRTGVRSHKWGAE